MQETVGADIGGAMDYVIYQLEFQAGVHFGDGMLSDTRNTFQADTLFSALYIGALKAGVEGWLYDAVSSGRLLFSDGFPYMNDCYFIPKPMIYIDSGNKGNSSDKKKVKRLKYLPEGQLEGFLSGRMELDKDPMESFGEFSQRTMASVRTEKETLPFQVGVYSYHEGNGLYVIVGYQEERLLGQVEDLLEILSYEGIGGKRASGLGRFTFKKGKNGERLLGKLKKDGAYRMLLSAALPIKEDMELALEGASYLLEKRSGFIASDTYASEFRKKKDLYVFSAGSCFRHTFRGGVYDVSEGGSHPVYRYGMPMFMGV